MSPALTPSSDPTRSTGSTAPETTENAGAPRPRPSIRVRVTAAAGSGLICLLGLVAVTGLLGAPVGAGDNGDGPRLYCGAGLVPQTADQLAEWKGGVVLGFDRVTACAGPAPSSALLVLRAATVGATDGWSLTRLGWTYAVLLSLVVAVAAWATSARGLSRMLVLVPPVLPLLQVDVARFLVSTFAEPAGLLGAVTLYAGLGTVLVTGRQDRAERVTGTALMVAGGLVAGTAKVGYVPLLGVAVVICALTAVQMTVRGRRRDRVIGPLAAAVLALAAVAPISASLAWQTQTYGPINQHNLIYTTVLTEMPGSAADLGLPAEAESSAGDAYYPDGPADVSGADVIAADPAAARTRAWRALLSHPAALARAIGVGMQATQGQALDYLPSGAWSAETEPLAVGTSVGAQGAEAAQLRAWLDGMAHPWWPSLLAVLGLVVGMAGLRWRAPLGSALARTAGVSAASALALTVIAVLGDGYFEIAKHVWLAAYLLDLTAVALIGAALVAVHGIVQSLRSTRTARTSQLRRT
jgi:hypothetical protein